MKELHIYFGGITLVLSICDILWRAGLHLAVVGSRTMQLALHEQYQQPSLGTCRPVAPRGWKIERG